MYNIDYYVIEEAAREAVQCTHQEYGWCSACRKTREQRELERVRELALPYLLGGYIVQIGNTRQGCLYRTPEQMCQYLANRGCDFQLLTLEEAQAGMRRFLAFRQEAVMRGFTHVATMAGAVPVHEWTPYGLYGGINDPLGIDGDDDFVWVSEDTVMNVSVFANPPRLMASGPQPPFLAGAWKFLTPAEADTYLPPGVAFIV